MRWSLLVFLTLPLSQAVAVAVAADGGGEHLSFSRDVLPILSEYCFKCHGPDEKGRQGDLRLDTEEGAFSTRDGTSIIKPGDVQASELIRRVMTSDQDSLMPPPSDKHPLSPPQLEMLKRWVEQGAPWGKHWAFEPLQAPEIPVIDSAVGSAINPIDSFVLARLKQEGLAASPAADKITLIRRLCLDLTGLPPTPEEVDAFVSDETPEAYERLVDRLLSSTRYGERMVWDWLEAARYADSNGYQGDGERTMYPWRDWAISAFNRNIPFDQFTIWQLAGDLLPDATHEQTLATGFLRNHMINGEGGRIPAENRVDYVLDMTETTGTVWLALTLNCSRCHDHKFDPIQQADYYSLYDFFNQTPVDGAGGNPQTPPVLMASTPEQAEQLAAANAEREKQAEVVQVTERELFRVEGDQPHSKSPRAADLPEEIKQILDLPAAERDSGRLQKLIEKFTTSDLADYKMQLEALKAAVDRRNAIDSSIPRVMVMADQPEKRETYILEKGLYNKPTERRVSAATPQALPEMSANATRSRLGLAQWLVSHENPLTPRVVVNRFWQQVFGIGLVKTSEDFGVQGEKPSHPELLDWLAADFRDHGWDVKRLMKLIVMSGTYRQSSAVISELVERDPQNRLLARGARYRMPSWMIRDQALAASGLLVDRLGGPPVRPYQPEGVWEEATFGNKTYVPDQGDSLYRRSVYTFWRRIVGPTMFFDVAPRQTCVVKPIRTNTPLQALAIMNDVQYVEAARVLAERSLKSTTDLDGQLSQMMRRLLGRLPDPDELALLRESYQRQLIEFERHPTDADSLLKQGASTRDASLAGPVHAAMTGVGLILLNLDETLTRE